MPCKAVPTVGVSISEGREAAKERDKEQPKDEQTFHGQTFPGHHPHRPEKEVEGLT